MVRTPGFHKNGMKKGAWSEEEDNLLRAYVQTVQQYGLWNWRELPKYAGLARCGKSCRLRWLNYLKPGVRRGNYTKEEEDLIIELHEELGTRWSAIARRLPGRTDNDIKNHWHTHLKKRVKPDPAICKVIDQPKEASKSESNDKEQSIATVQLEASQKKLSDASHQQSLQSLPLSPEQSLHQFSFFNDDYTVFNDFNWDVDDWSITSPISSEASNEKISHVALEFMVDAPSQQTLQSFGASPEEISYLANTNFELLSGINLEAEDSMTSLLSSEASIEKSHEAVETVVVAQPHQKTLPSFIASPEQYYSEISSLLNTDYALMSCIDWASNESLASENSYSEPIDAFWAATHMSYNQNVDLAPIAEGWLIPPFFWEM